MVGLPGGRRSDAHELGRSFLTACFGMPTTIPHMQRMVSRFPGGEDQQLLLDYQLADGSIEFSIDFAFSPDESMFGKEMAVTFTGFGIQGEKFEDEDIMTTPAIGCCAGRWKAPRRRRKSGRPTPRSEICGT